MHFGMIGMLVGDMQVLQGRQSDALRAHIAGCAFRVLMRIFVNTLAGE